MQYIEKHTYDELKVGDVAELTRIFPGTIDLDQTLLGARVPIVLTRRSHDVSSRLASCASTILFEHHHRSELSS